MQRCSTWVQSQKWQNDLGSFPRQTLNITVIQTIWPLFWETCTWVKKQQLELDMEQPTNWFKVGKEVWCGCILSPCLYNIYAEYIMRNAGLDESQTEIKLAGRNVNNLRYTNDTTLMAESQEELKKECLNEGDRREWKSWNFWNSTLKKTKMVASDPITSWQIEGQEVEAVTVFIFLGSRITADFDCSHKIKRCILLGRKTLTNIDSVLKSRDITLPTKVHIFQ